MTLRRALRRGASPFVDVGWALHQFMLLLGELTVDAALAVVHRYQAHRR